MADAARGLLLALLALAGPGMAGAAPIAFLVAEKAGEVQHGDSYVLVLEADADVAHARALVAGAGAPPETIVVASIAAGADGVNRDHRAPGAPAWSWHVSAFSEFAEATIELCDGWPGEVEADVGGWIANTGGQVCFWSYTVVEEIGPVPEPGQGVLLAVGAALLLVLRLKPGAGSRDTLRRMRGTLRVAWLLLALFAVQAGTQAAVSAAGSACCPAMAAAGHETPAPCRTLSAVGCCEARSGAATPDVSVPAAAVLLSSRLPAAACAEPPVRRPAESRGEPPSTLRTTVLRL